MYALWSLIYAPLAIWYYYKNIFTLSRAVISYIREFFLSGQHYNSWILWYLLSSIYAFIAILVANKIFKSIKPWMLFLSVASLVLYVGLHLYKGEADINPTIRLLNGCIYIPLGMLSNSLCENFSRVTVRIAILLSFIIQFILLEICMCPRILLDVICVPIAFCLFLLIIKSRMIIGIKTVKLRKISSVIYYIHLWIWSLYYWLVYGEKTYGMDSFIVVSFISIAVGTIWVRKKKDRNENNLK